MYNYVYRISGFHGLDSYSCMNFLWSHVHFTLCLSYMLWLKTIKGCKICVKKVPPFSDLGVSVHTFVSITSVLCTCMHLTNTSE